MGVMPEPPATIIIYLNFFNLFYFFNIISPLPKYYKDPAGPSTSIVSFSLRVSIHKVSFLSSGINS